MSSPNVLRAIAACVALSPALAAAAPAVDQQQPTAVSLSEDPGLLVGGPVHQVLAQVVTAGRAGALVAVAVPVFCLDGASLALEIRGVHPDAYGREVPDGTVRARATMPAAFLQAFADATAPDFRMLPLSAPVGLEAGDRFSFVLSATGSCGLARGPGGDPYAGGDASFIDDVHAPAELDAGAIDAASVRFALAAPAVDGRGRPRASLEDVNGDGFADLVLHFAVPALAIRPGDVEAALTGSTRAPDAWTFTATDRIRVVPPPRPRATVRAR